MFDYCKAHEKQLIPLIQSVINKSHSHAYIFAGPDGIGKYAVAMEFAKALTCLSADASSGHRPGGQCPCGECANCKLTDSGNNPDIFTLSLTQKTTAAKSIGVDDIRDFVSEVYVKPYSSGKKIYIIDDAQTMTDQAQNALLKILEEPPEYIVFILLTTSAAACLPTVRSRSEQVRFSPVSASDIKSFILQMHPDISPAFANVLTQYSQGVPGVAASLADDADFEDLRKGCTKQLDNILSSNALKNFDAADFFDTNKQNAQTVLNIWVSLLNDILLISLNSRDKIVNTDIVGTLENMSYLAGQKQVFLILEQLLKVFDMLKRYVNPRSAILSALFRANPD